MASATSGEQAAEDMRDEEVPEESGGPFVESERGKRVRVRHGRVEPERGGARSLPDNATTEVTPCKGTRSALTLLSD